MKIDRIKPEELKIGNICEQELCSTMGMVSLSWKFNSLILLYKTLNCVMNIIEMRADTNIHILES